MITHIDRVGIGRRLSADVCIVGAGAAGITIANELLSSGLCVLVLESGMRGDNAATQSLYDTDVVGLKHSGVHELRFRTFGGSTTRWAGQAVPLGAMDFDSRPWVPSSGWPLSLTDLHPYYGRAARHLRIPPFPLDRTDWPAALPPPPAIDIRNFYPYYSEFAPSPNFAKTFEQTLARSKAVRVILGANVIELVSDPHEARVSLATVRSLSGREYRVYSDYFVVCCGGIETARLLLASDRYDEGGLGNGHGLVGRYFQDHPGLAVGRIHARPGQLTALAPVRQRGVKFLTKLGASDRLQRDERLVNATAEVVYEQAPSLRAARELFRGIRRQGLRGVTKPAIVTFLRDPIPPFRAAVRHFALGHAASDTTGPAYLCIGGEQSPYADSRVELSPKTDALGSRRAILDWRLTDLDLKTLRRFAELAANEFEAVGLGCIDPNSVPKTLDDVLARVVDAGHHMGTTRMGADEATSVVDKNCRVHGFSNLYVGSTSVFPTSGRSNPTFTLLALCIRLADLLREQARAAA